MGKIGIIEGKEESKPKRDSTLHKKLIQEAKRWLYRVGCGAVFVELTTAATEIPDAIGLRSTY